MKKKGDLKTGGRPKGIPNKVTSTTRDWVQKLISDNQKGFEVDLRSLEARDRLIILEKMKMRPKMIEKQGFDSMYCTYIVSTTHHQYG